VEVTTASQEKESLLETPAIVSVITAQQLKEWGVQNVYEALSFLPGIVVNETYMGYSVVTFRGVTPGLFNNKALFMINGHPSYERLFGSGHTEFIPIEAIKRIEVVRSPASSLYGTNAVSGVVNIITKQGIENANEVTARVGSNDHYYGNFNLYNANMTLSGSIQKDRGYNYGGTSAEDPHFPAVYPPNPALAGTPVVVGGPHIVDMNYQDDLANLFLDVHDETWGITAAYSTHEDARFGFNPFVWLNGINEQESFYIDVNKNFSIDDGQLNIWLRYDYADKVYHAGEFPFPAGTAHPTVAGRTSTETTMYNTVQRYSAEVQYKKKVSDAFSYIVGMTGEYDEATSLDFLYDSDGTRNDNGGFTVSPHTKTYAAYGQVKYRFNEEWVGIAGIRGEDNDIVGFSGIVPRLGLTYKAAKDTYIKALYSEAFRTPVFLEQYVYVPGFTFGDINLDREEVKNYELALDSALNKENQLQVTLYYLELRKEITRRPAGGGTTEYFNSPGRNMYGVEVEWKSILSQSFEMMLNASYSNGEDKTTEYLEPGFDGDAPFIANYTANLVLTYHINNQWSGTLSDQFIGSKDYVLQDGTTGSIGHYNLTNLVLTYSNFPFESSLSVKNIFDEKYTYPEPVRRNIHETPGGPGTTAYLTVRYKF
jgi:iron complex outermembrane receptor protein